MTGAHQSSSVEAAFIIIASCIPSLRPFVRALGRSPHLDQAKSLFIPKGYYHSHSTRHRPPPLVPRESGSGTTAVPSPRDKHERKDDLESGNQEKKLDSAEPTPPSTAMTDKSVQKRSSGGYIAGLGKSSWWGCGGHVPQVMDSLPKDSWCTCDPKIEREGKMYPPQASGADILPDWVKNLAGWFGHGNKKDEV
ncbi:MAG: hypothetical protein Q9170_002604 [Blastenia crenularia]